MFTLAAIYATDNKGGIGFKGRLPWRHPADIRHFWKTIGSDPVIIGSGTWNGAKKFFFRERGPNRIYIVLSTKEKPRLHFEEGSRVYYVDGVGMALEVAKAMGRCAWVCGGKAIYELFAPMIDVWVASRIEKTYCCDTYLSWDAPPGADLWDRVDYCTPNYPDLVVDIYARETLTKHYDHFTNLGLDDLLESVWR